MTRECRAKTQKSPGEAFASVDLPAAAAAAAAAAALTSPEDAKPEHTDQ